MRLHGLAPVPPPPLLSLPVPLLSRWLAIASSTSTCGRRRSRSHTRRSAITLARWDKHASAAAQDVDVDARDRSVGGGTTCGDNGLSLHHQ
jgi:hypothetical protein